MANRKNPKQKSLQQLFDKLQADPELRQQARRDIAPVVEGLDAATRTALAGHRRSDWLLAIGRAGLVPPAPRTAGPVPPTPHNNVFNVYLRDAAPSCGHDDCAELMGRFWSVASSKLAIGNRPVSAGSNEIESRRGKTDGNRLARGGGKWNAVLGSSDARRAPFH